MTTDERRCPKCGAQIRSATISGPDGAELHPCGHKIPADHPVLTTEDDEENDQ